MAKVVDVTSIPDIPGAGMLHFDDGRQPMMALPEIADDYRTHLGITDDRLAMTPQQSQGKAPPVATDAQTGVGTVAPTGDAYRDRWGQVHTPDAGYTVEHTNRYGGKFTTQEDELPVRDITGTPEAAAMAAKAQQPAPAAPVPDVVPPMLARPPEVAPTQPPTTGDMVSAARDYSQQKAADEILHGKVVPGGPGSPGGYRPTTAETTTEHGAPYDPALAGMRMDADRQVLDANLAQSQAQKITADAQAAKAAALVPVYQQQQAAAQNEINVKQAQYQAQRQKLEDDLQVYTDSARPNPNRYFENQGVVGNIMSAIGQSLGAFGASLNHTQNYAFDYVQNQIKNDIQTQVANYQAGRSDRTSALGRMMDYYHGDMDMAKNALAIAMNKVVQTETAQFAAQSQSQQISSAANVFAAQFQKDSLNREQNLYTASLGKTTTKDSEKYHDPVAASGPHRRALTSAEETHDQKTLGADKPHAGQGFEDLNARGAVKTTTEYGNRKAEVSEARQALKDLAAAYGLTVNPETNELVGPDGKPVDPDKVDIAGNGRWKGHLPEFLISNEGENVRTVQSDAIAKYVHAMSGASFHEEEVTRAKKQIVGANDHQTVVNLQRQLRDLDDRDRALDSAYPQQVVQIHRSREAETNKERVQRGGAQPKVTPYTGRNGGSSDDSKDDNEKDDD